MKKTKEQTKKPSNSHFKWPSSDLFEVVGASSPKNKVRPLDVGLNEILDVQLKIVNIIELLDLCISTLPDMIDDQPSSVKSILKRQCFDELRMILNDLEIIDEKVKTKTMENTCYKNNSKY